MDKLPPHHKESEMAIIGACITEPVIRMPEAQSLIVSPDYFYDVRCRTSWECIIKMRVSDVNIITVSDELKGMPNACAFLSECQDTCVSAANLPVWLQTLKEKYMLRQIIARCTEAISQAYSTEDAVICLDAVERDILKIRPQQHESKNIKSLLNEATSMIEAKALSQEISGLTTGLRKLDLLTDGLHPGELIVIAAPPSCGKTALGVNIAIKNALDGLPVGIMSAEMRPVQLVIRSICSESRVNYRRITEGDFSTIVSTTGRLAHAPLFIEPASGFTIGQVSATARRLKQKHGIQILLVDYIQLLEGTGDNREQKIASVSRGLKAIASELDCTVLGLSQLNDDGRLRESRAIGMDADTVWKIENKGEWLPDQQPVILTVQKCRDGETGSIELVFQKTITRFDESLPTEDYYQS